MAIKIKVLTKSGLDIRKLFTHAGHIDDIDPRGSSRFTADDDSHNYSFDVRGSGFKYSPVGTPTDGLVSRITIDKGSSPQLQIDLSPKLAVKKALKASSLESFIDNQPIHMTGNNGNDTFAAGKKNDILKGGKGNDNLEGGRGNDTIYGDAGNDTLRGGKDNDKLFGGQGNDKLHGSAGNDLLTGDLGLDNLYGGAGADRFIFNSLADSKVGSQRDVIRDFQQSQGDRIDLRKIDAISGGADDPFTFIGNNVAFNNVKGELRFQGNILQGDTNGDGNADFEIRVLNVAALNNGDFLL